MKEGRKEEMEGKKRELQLFYLTLLTIDFFTCRNMDNTNIL